MNVFKSPKLAMALALALLCLVAIASFHTPALALSRLILIIATLVTSDYAISYYRKVAIGKPISSLVIGETIFLISSPESSIFQIFLALVVSIVAKHYLKRSEKHVVNSVALGVFVASLFGLEITWWGILPGLVFSTLTVFLTGISTIYLLHQERIVVPFVLTALGTTFFFTKSLLATYTQFIIGGFWFFTLVLLPDPTSSPTNSKYKIFYGFSVAIFSILIPRLGVPTEPLLTGLLLGNILFWYLENQMQDKLGMLAKKLPLASKLIVQE